MDDDAVRRWVAGCPGTTGEHLKAVLEEIEAMERVDMPGVLIPRRLGALVHPPVKAGAAAEAEPERRSYRPGSLT